MKYYVTLLMLLALCFGASKGVAELRVGSVASPRTYARMLKVRGGAIKSKVAAKGKPKKPLKVNSLDSRKSLLKSLKEAVAQVKPATRVYMILSLFCTFVHMVGLPAPELFALSSSRFWEVWRPFTAMAYLISHFLFIFIIKNIIENFLIIILIK